MELTLEELEALEPGSYTLLDLRSEQEAAYGTIPGSVPANAAALPEGLPAEPGRIVPVSYTHLGLPYCRTPSLRPRRS